MRRLLALCSCSAALCPAGLCVPAAPAGTPPSVSFVRYAPLEVAGKGFGRARVVHVRVAWKGGSLARDVRTSPAGRFTARWTVSVRPHVCQGLVVTATTKAGTRAVVRPPIVLCGGVPPPGPPKN